MNKNLILQIGLPVELNLVRIFFHAKPILRAKFFKSIQWNSYPKRSELSHPPNPHTNIHRRIREILIKVFI